MRGQYGFRPSKQSARHSTVSQEIFWNTNKSSRKPPAKVAVCYYRTMRKIIVQEFITLDGVMQAPGGPDEDTSSGFKYGGWTAPYYREADAEADEFMAEVMKSSDLLLGRKTFD